MDPSICRCYKFCINGNKISISLHHQENSHKYVLMKTCNTTTFYLRLLIEVSFLSIPLLVLTLVRYNLVHSNSWNGLFGSATCLLIINCCFAVTMFLDNVKCMKRKTNGSYNYFIVYRKQPEIVTVIFTWEYFGEGYSQRMI